MSVSVSNLGSEMYRDWNRPIRQATLTNMINSSLSHQRMQANGEIGWQHSQTAESHYLNHCHKIGSANDGQMGENGRGRFTSDYEPQVAGGSRPLDDNLTNKPIKAVSAEYVNRKLNPLYYNTITGRPQYIPDNKIGGLRQWYAGVVKTTFAPNQQNDPDDAVESNYPARKYMFNGVGLTPPPTIQQTTIPPWEKPMVRF
jgi:hypothetical protein